MRLSLTLSNDTVTCNESVLHSVVSPYCLVATDNVQKVIKNFVYFFSIAACFTACCVTLKREYI